VDVSLLSPKIRDILLRLKRTLGKAAPLGWAEEAIRRAVACSWRAIRYDIDEQRRRQSFHDNPPGHGPVRSLFRPGLPATTRIGSNGEPESIYGGRSIVITKHTSCFLL
jgi:hypothetical protein